jgi:alanine dehydrogenase
VARLYSDDDQEAVSMNVIETLARETARPVAEVREIYESEFARLREGARITDYLILFASRRTRIALAQRQRPAGAVTQRAPPPPAMRSGEDSR